jgi:3-deoxy-7-phosphoheptulonate synthase
MQRPLFGKEFPGQLCNLLGKSPFVIFAGPCSIDQSFPVLAADIASLVAGFRGGVFKARTSPYDFSGLGQEGLSLIEEAGKRYNRPIVVEVLSAQQLPFLEKVDILQIGARNMYNYPLLKDVAETGKPILLKRHFSATIDELLLAAEHILAAGNERVILCERGIRTFETRYRSTLDLAAVIVLKQMTHLPVMVDPSHAAGDSSLVPGLVLAAAAAGADGAIIEVHQNPVQACSDGPQAITPQILAHTLDKLEKILPILKPVQG